MKKILLVLFLFSACALSAQTTCEMRVDAHQKASTMQRVDYCLNAPVVLDPMDNAEVIYYGVITQDQQNGKEEKDTAKDGYYDDTKLEVSRGYLGTRQFPAFTNDTLSESEREYQRRHLQAAKEEIARQQAEKVAAAKAEENQKLAAAQKSQAPQQAQLAATAPVQIVKADNGAAAVKETKKGVLSRQKKPARKDNVVVIPEAIAVTSEHMQVVTEDAVYDISQPSYTEQAPVYPSVNEAAPVAQPAQEQYQPENMPEHNPYYESGVAVNAPVTYDQISQN